MNLADTMSTDWKRKRKNTYLIFIINSWDIKYLDWHIKILDNRSNEISVKKYKPHYKVVLLFSTIINESIGDFM